jgi:hypothetical protein
MERRLPPLRNSSDHWRPVMLIDGWQIDENELHGFNRKWRARWSARDFLFECKRSDFACLIYSITEVRMNRLAGRLAVYQCKANPALILNPRHFECRFWDTEVPIEYSHAGRILFVKGSRRSSGSVPLCVIDLDARRFALVDKGEPSFTPAVQEITKRRVRLEFSAQNGHVESAVIDLDELVWHDLRKL